MKRTIRRVLAGACGIVLALVIGELVARSRADDRWLHRPPKLEVVFRPDPARMPGITGDSRYRTSSLGLRASEHLGHAHRVLAIGGSTTACEYLDQEEAWPELVEARLGARDTWVGNAGGSGLALVDHLLQVRSWGAEIEGLDVVIVLVGVNDLAQAIQHRGAVPEPGPDEVRRRAFFDWPRTFGWLPPSHTALAHFARQSRTRRWAIGALEDEEGANYDQRRARRAAAREFESMPPDVFAGELALYRKRLTQLVRRTRAVGAEPLALTQPVLWRTDLEPADCALLWYGWIGAPPWLEPSGYVDLATLVDGMRAYNDVLREVCAELDVTLVDLAAELPRTREVFYDDCHFNERGADLVAELVAPAVAELLAARD